jgi:hypothetical protein
MRLSVAEDEHIATSVNESYDYKGFAVVATASQINHTPNEAWRPLYRINGQDQSQAWTPRDRNVIFPNEKAAIAEASKRAQWLIDNFPPTPSEVK